MSDPRSARQSALIESLPPGVDVLLVTHLPNIRWLTGFSGSAGMLLIGADRCTLITDFRYASQAPREVGEAAEVMIDRASVWDRLRRVLEGYGRSTVAIEAHVTPVRDAERISGLFHGRVVPVVDLVEQLRQSKDDTEITAIRAAAALATEALAEVLPGVAVGDSELQIAARLEYALRRRGSEWHPFPTIVASGPRAALPHARSSDRAIQAGEFLLIDFGAQVDGYCADITRTVGIRTVDERQRAVYELVRDAQLNARQAIRAGMTGREADALARDLITSRGYGDAFGHSLGHGLGLEVHEAPRLAATAEAVLPVGAVVTIEPGIYLSGWGGVRLEDDVLLAAGGPVLLSDGRTDLIILDA